jgi:GT2 family glycosyltransferase
MDLSIIIVSWNTCDLVMQCLASIYTHPPDCQFEVVIVDNASTDDSVKMLREHYSQARLIENSENVGFARANNQAVPECTGRYILFLNPDTRVMPGALETLVQFMEAHPKAGATGAQILNPDGSLQLSCYPAPTLRRELWRLLHLDALWPYGEYRMADWNLEASQEIDAMLGACLILRREALDQTGLFDRDYFMYSEEIDLCYRLRQKGWRLYWVPLAKIIHCGGQSTQQVASKMLLQLYKSKIIYFRKHHGRLSAFIYKLILLITALPRLVISPLAWLEPQPKRGQHLNLARNYFQLIIVLPRL